MPLTPLHFLICFHNPSLSLLRVGKVERVDILGALSHNYRIHRLPVWKENNQNQYWFLFTVLKHKHYCVFFQYTFHMVQTTNSCGWGNALRVTSTSGHYLTRGPWSPWWSLVAAQYSNEWKSCPFMTINHSPFSFSQSFGFISCIWGQDILNGFQVCRNAKDSGQIIDPFFLFVW